MITMHDTIAGDDLTFRFVENGSDCHKAAKFVKQFSLLAFDTEANRINPYHPDWYLRTFQIGHGTEAYVIPAKFRSFIWWAMTYPEVKLIGHNATHDVRCVDAHLGRQTYRTCAETYIACHNQDSRNQAEGGAGHALKAQAVAYIDRQAGKWEKELKAAFKQITVPIPGEVYKSGPRQGEQKVRKIKLAEGWQHISLTHPAYIAYAASDPVLTFRRWEQLKPYVKSIQELYKFDKKLDIAVDILQRRGMLLDVPYTTRLSNAYESKADRLQRKIDTFVQGEVNINSTDQVANVLLDLGVKLTDKTDTGKWAVTGDILRRLRDDPYTDDKTRQFIRLVLLTKQLRKRRSAYTEGMLNERDINDRVHPSINSQAARTFRMSVSNPAFQQLPTKDHEDEEAWEVE